jgi:hypothetical protein
MDVSGVTQSEARADEIGVGIQGSAAWRVMVATEISGDPEPMVEIVSNRTANAVLVETPGASQAEVGVTERGIYGLGARRDDKYGHCDQEKDELFHTVMSFRAFKCVRIRAMGGEYGQGAVRRLF